MNPAEMFMGRLWNKTKQAINNRIIEFFNILNI